MNKILAILVFILSGTWTAHAQNLPCTDTAALAKKLKEIRETDQQARAEFIKQLPEHNQEKTRKLALQMKTADQQNQQFVATLLDQCGWPKGLSSTDNHTLFLVIDHAEESYMTRYFPLLKAQAELGVVPKTDLGTLEDRLLLRKGQPQLYGTQTFKKGGTVYVWPVANIGELAERRKLAGFPPMEDYLETVKKTYRSEISWDKDMTVEAAQQKMQEKP